MSRPPKCPRLEEPELKTPIDLVHSEQINSIGPITKIVRIGSRKSKLALIQTELVIELLRRVYNSETSNVKFEFELVTITTKGDRIIDQPLAQIGSKALFTKELETALIDQEIDLIVHSCKDLPTTLPEGLRIAAILSRENPNDVLVVKNGNYFSFTNEQEFLKTLKKDTKRNWTVGTSSLRRVAQLKHLAPEVRIEDIRGNIDTRLRHLDSPDRDYAALILAAAGLKRAGFGDRISASLRDNWWHAVGQGAIALECRENDEFIHNLLYPLIHFKTTYEIIAERSFMQYLEGGCSVPLGVKCWFGDHDQQVTTYQKKMVIIGNNVDKKNESNGNGVKNDENSYNKNVGPGVKEQFDCINKRADFESEQQKNGKQCGTQKQVTTENAEHTKEAGDTLANSACPVLTAKRTMEAILKQDQSVAQEEFNTKDQFDCNDISNLTLSGIVYSPDGQRRVQFCGNLADAVEYFEQQIQQPQPKVNCSHISLPTRACPKLQQVRIDYVNCAKLGIYVARKMIELGAQDILDELKKVRHLSESTEQPELDFVAI